MTTNNDHSVLERLAKAGSNLSLPHPMEFYLYFATEKQAQDAAVPFLADGFTSRITEGAEGEQWLCRLTKNLIPDIDTIVSLRQTFEAVTRKDGGEYDGWGTTVVS